MTDPARVLPMVFALAAALGFFAVVMLGKLRLLGLAAGQRDFGAVLATGAANLTRRVLRLPRTLGTVLVYFLGQRKFFKKQERSSGVMHAFIFWGFLVLAIRSLYLITIAFVPDARVPLSHDGYSLLKDVTELVVLVAVCFALYRRLVTRPSRLTASGEAVVILFMIGSLMVTDFLYDGFLFGTALADGTASPELLDEMAFAFVGGALGQAFQGVDPALGAALRELFYWSHICILLVFLNLLPGSKHFHVITSLFNVFLSDVDVRPRGALAPIEDLEEQETFGVSHVLEFTPKQLLDTYTCTECGRCTVNCPTTITGKPLNPKKLITDIRDHLYRREPELLAHGGPAADYEGPSLVDDVGYDQIWDCTSCRACSEMCPVMIEHVDKIVDLRRYLTLMEANFPKELGATLRNLENKGNPWGLPAGDRTLWADGLEVPTLAEAPDAEYLFWVGCAGAYDDQQKKVSVALVKLLREAGVSFAILGDEETCTGDSARRAGNEYLFQMMAQQNIELLQGYGVDKKKIVTHCPHCLNTLKHEYPQFGGTFDVVHHSELIGQLMRAGKITPKTTPAGVGDVAFHDSCYLGRYNDIYDEPREVLAKIPGLRIKEMERSRQSGMCCGAGGARAWMEEHHGERVNQTRVQQALETKPDTIAVACPFCKMMLADGVNELGVEGVRTKDIAELVADSLG